MRSTAARALVAISLAALLAGPAAAAALPPPPTNLLVDGGEETWHSDRRFRLFWTNPAVHGGPAIVAVHYRVLAPAGTVALGPARIGWPATSTAFDLAGPPGTYTAEIWLEDEASDIGSPAVARLRFDDLRPGAVEPSVPATWIGRTAFPLTVRIGHPGGALPVSGIRGYAISVGAAPGGRPCEAAEHCSSAETDLHGGLGDDSYRIADLPQGAHHLQAVAVSGSGMASTAVGETVFRVDKTSPAVRLDGVPAEWVNHPVELTASASDKGSGLAPAGGGAVPFTAVAIDGGVPKTAIGATVTATVIGEGAHRVAYYARDVAGNVDDGGRSNGQANEAPPTALVRIDRQPPRVSFVNSQSSADPELIRVRVIDALSGPSAGRGWIGVRRVGSGDRFAPLPLVAAPGGELRARWDSDADPAGNYEFRALAFDRADNGAATGRRADGRPMLLQNPLKAVTELRAGFGERSSRRVVPCRAGSSFGGVLRTAAGTRLGGMQIRVVERFSAPPSARARTVTTGPDGGFAICLAAGPSREVTAHFAGTPRLSRSSTPILKLAVRTRIAMRASSQMARVGGRPIVFEGRIAAAPGTIPANGKSVQLQFRLPGLAWSEFRTIQTDRRGRFRYAYRFSDDDSRGALFQFRAYAPAQLDWPYEPAGSRPVTVRGR
jgi:hypothetical protein